MPEGLIDNAIRKEVFLAMQEGLPLASYKKTIFAQLRVKILDPIRLMEEEVILKGDPELNEESCQVKIWSSAEDKYLRRNNKFHFESGALVPFSAAQEESFQVNQISDEEIEAVLIQPFFTLKNKLESFTSTIPVRRFLSAAERLNRPVRTIELLKKKLADLEQKVSPVGET